MRVSKSIRLEDMGLELSLIPEKVEEAASMALSLDRMVLTAKAICPVDTGALMASIRAERRGPIESALVAGGGGYMNPKTGKLVDYARQVHDGTSHKPARPFLLQAVQAESLRLAREILEKTGELMA